MGSGVTVTVAESKVGNPTGVPVGGNVPGPALPSVSSDPGTAPGAKILLVPGMRASIDRLKVEGAMPGRRKGRDVGLKSPTPPGDDVKGGASAKEGPTASGLPGATRIGTALAASAVPGSAARAPAIGVVAGVRPNTRPASLNRTSKSTKSNDVQEHQIERCGRPQPEVVENHVDR